MRLTIAKVHENLYEGEAYSVLLPGEGGQFEVLSHHAPLVAKLRAGTISVRASRDAEPKKFETKGGVVEVSGNAAIVLL